MQERLATLPLIEAALWQELARATHDKQHEWHTPVLATTDGTVADARTVVLREVDLEARQLVCYSDSRAPKATLKKHPFSQRRLATISECGMEGSKRPILEPTGRAWRSFKPAFRLYRRTCAMSRFRLMKMLASASAVNARVAFLASPR